MSVAIPASIVTPSVLVNECGDFSFTLMIHYLADAWLFKCYRVNDPEPLWEMSFDYSRRGLAEMVIEIFQNTKDPLNLERAKFESYMMERML